MVQRGSRDGCAETDRDDMTTEELRRLAWRETNGRVASRLLDLVLALDGMDRGQAARLAGIDLRASSSAVDHR